MIVAQTFWTFDPIFSGDHHHFIWLRPETETEVYIPIAFMFNFWDLETPIGSKFEQIKVIEKSPDQPPDQSPDHD